MTVSADRIAAYVAYLHASVKSRSVSARGPELPADLAELCRHEPRECLELVLRTLEQVTDPHLISAVGTGLLQNLLNESSGVLGPAVSRELETNSRFRQAFASGQHASVDPALIEEWVEILDGLGTSKVKERKSLWRRPRQS